MKTLQEKAKIDNEVMKALKLDFIDTMIAQTPRGNLTLRLRLDQTSDEYVFVLDSVVQDKETNQKLLKLFNGIIYTC